MFEHSSPNLLKRIVIIGNGIAGTTAARYLRKLDNNCSITMISSEYPWFYSRTALMYIYMGHMTVEHTKPYEDWFWKKNRIDLVFDHVDQVDTQKREVSTRQGKRLPFDYLIIASGSTSRMLPIKGNDAAGVQGLYGIPDLESMEKFTKDIQEAAVVGGGLIGIEMVEMLVTRGIKTTFIVREKEFYDPILPGEEAAMISRHIRDHHINLMLETEAEEILKDNQGRVRGIKTKQGEIVSCQFAGITVGVQPNVDFLQGSGIEVERGVMTDGYLQTNVEGIFAAGDCLQLRKPQPGRAAIEPLWYTGRMQGEVVAHNIAGKKRTYDAGIWFNSAKFFDIEYQVYGFVPPEIPPGLISLFWEHPDGTKSIRINYDAETKAVKGFNLLGIRYRQEVCEEWIMNEKHVKDVLKDLDRANFDREFSNRYESQLKDIYDQLENGGNQKPTAGFRQGAETLEANLTNKDK